mmetsp:Transcript_28252/g.45933  ORF Transcript_28252/g.45933 Transcript_28252/m.45933 type:complete len:319 (-) Transcript_28252:79-1035(-)
MSYRQYTLCHSQLVITICRNISNPRQRLVTAPLDDLQIPNLNSRHSKVRYLKLDPDRLLPRRVHPSAATASFALRIIPGNTRQAKVRPHQILPSSVELLDRPDHAILVRQVRHVAHARFEARTIHIGRDRNRDLHVIRHAPRLELRSRLDHVLDPRSAMGFHHGLHPDERLDVSVQPVRHEVELAVRRDERYGAIVLEPSESNALVELDVLQLDGLAGTGLSAPSRGLEHELVVQAQLELGHAGEEGLHLDGTVDLGVQHGTVGRHEEVELLDDVEEYLVLLVLDALGAPGDGVGERHGGLALGVVGHAVALLGDEGS